MINLLGESVMKTVRFLHSVKSYFIIEESDRNHLKYLKLPYHRTKNCYQWIKCKAKTTFILGIYPNNQ